MSERTDEPIQTPHDADLEARYTHAYDYSLPVDFVPQRVVSLVPSLTESLFELNLGQRVVGVTDYCIYPESTKALPKVGGTKNPDLEKIKALALKHPAYGCNRHEAMLALELMDHALLQRAQNADVELPVPPIAARARNDA